MIKVDYKADHAKGLVMYSFECNKEEDFEALDMLWQVLDQMPDTRVGYASTNRLVVHFKGLKLSSTETNDKD